MKFKIPDTPEELFRQGSQSILKMNKWFPMIAFIFIVLFIVMTSFYMIDPDEVGVIRRFGKYTRTTQPGLHWKLPFNLEKLNKVRVKFIYKEEFGFRTLQAGINTKYSSQSFNNESLMLTGDLNVLDVTWIVQYRVKDPVMVLFNIRNPRETVRDLSEAVMRLVIGDSSVTEALTTRRIEINTEVEKRLQVLLDSYQSGIHIETVKLQDVNPPEKVKRSFNEVNEAKQEKEKIINQSRQAYNKVIPRARGEANKTIREAEGYALARIQNAKGDASLFIETWNAYKDAKQVTRKRLYLETMQEIIPEAGRIFIFEPGSNNILPLLNLNEGMSKK